MEDWTSSGNGSSERKRLAFLLSYSLPENRASARRFKLKNPAFDAADSMASYWILLLLLMLLLSFHVHNLRDQSPREDRVEALDTIPIWPICQIEDC